MILIEVTLTASCFLVFFKLYVSQSGHDDTSAQISSISQNAGDQSYNC